MNILPWWIKSCKTPEWRFFENISCARASSTDIPETCRCSGDGIGIYPSPQVKLRTLHCFAHREILSCRTCGLNFFCYYYYYYYYSVELEWYRKATSVYLHMTYQFREKIELFGRNSNVVHPDCECTRFGIRRQPALFLIQNIWIIYGCRVYFRDERPQLALMQQVRNREKISSSHETTWQAP